MSVERGPDMPAAEFEELLGRQPKLSAKWSVNVYPESRPWGELEDFRKRQLYEVTLRRAERAEALVEELRIALGWSEAGPHDD